MIEIEKFVDNEVEILVRLKSFNRFVFSLSLFACFQCFEAI